MPAGLHSTSEEWVRFPPLTLQRVRSSMVSAEAVSQQLVFIVVRRVNQSPRFSKNASGTTSTVNRVVAGSSPAASNNGSVAQR